MVSDHLLLRKVNRTLSITVGRGFDFYIYDDAHDEGQAICNADAEEALTVAAGIIYTVWTKNPDAANALVNSMQLHQFYDRIPEAWRERNGQIGPSQTGE